MALSELKVPQLPDFRKIVGSGSTLRIPLANFVSISVAPRTSSMRRL